MGWSALLEFACCALGKGSATLAIRLARGYVLCVRGFVLCYPRGGVVRVPRCERSVVRVALSLWLPFPLVLFSCVCIVYPACSRAMEPAFLGSGGSSSRSPERGCLCCNAALVRSFLHPLLFATRSI